MKLLIPFAALLLLPLLLWLAPFAFIYLCWSRVCACIEYFKSPCTCSGAAAEPDEDSGLAAVLKHKVYAGLKSRMTNASI